MPKDAIITLPNDDHTTTYLYRWSQQIITESVRHGVRFVKLVGKKAVRSELEGRIKKIKPSFIFLNGHGNSRTVTGYNEEPLVVCEDNENVLAGSITYALSCSSASELGKSSIEHGAKAYIGYAQDFYFMYEEHSLTHPENDSIAGYFLDPAYSVARALMKGNSAGEATNRGLEMHKKSMRALITSEAPFGAEQMLPYLFFNMTNLICHGDRCAKI